MVICQTQIEFEVVKVNFNVFLWFLAQDLSLSNGIFLILPVFCWMPVKTFNMFRELTKFETWLWIGGIELLVSTENC